LRSGQHIGPGHQAVPAGALQAGGIHIVFVCQFARGGGDGGRLHGRLGDTGRRLCDSFGVDLRDDLVAGHFRAIRLDDLREHAALDRRQFQHHLVGLDVDQVLPFAHGVADFLVPGEQRRLGHRLGKLRDFDFNDAHGALLVCS
jgi:hypothetical protein